MQKLLAFMNISLDGYYVDAHGDMSWAHRQDAEWNEFASQNAGGGGKLLFGRVTYEMMASWWPTPMAQQAMPAVAEGMNSMPKVVFSRTLEEASWSNTELVKGDLVTEVRRLKGEDGPGMAILGSGSIVTQLAEAGLIDEFQIVICPVALGCGKSLFEGLSKKLELRRTSSRVFENGNVVINYVAA
jgi:dihydrofolate reductase